MIRRFISRVVSRTFGTRSDSFGARRGGSGPGSRSVGTTLLVCAALLVPMARDALAQGSRKDDIVLNGRGQPLAGATIRVCTAAATGQPCTPLASIFSDQALTQALVNPTTTDGLGNYSFYAAPGRYMIEISGTGITTKQIPNVILPNDPSSPTFSSITTTSGISAFSLTLSGNLTVSGSAAVTGSLTVGGAAVPSTGVANTWTADQYFTSGRPVYDIMGKGASGSNQSTTGTMSAGGTAITLAAVQDFKNNQGIAVYGAGPLATLTAPTGLTVPPTNVVANIVASPVGVSRSGNVVTITTNFPHYFQVGQSVTIAGTSGCTTSPNGTFTVATAPTGITFTYAQTAGNETCGGGTVTIAAGATTYSYQVAAIDASGGLSAPAASVSTTTGYAALGPSTFIRLNWNCVTGAVMYAVYGRSGSLVAQAVAGPCDKGATTKSFDDLGNTLPVPSYVPNAVPAVATNQVLLTTISSGGGSTALVLATAATAAATNATVQHDDTAAIQAAVSAAKSNGGIVYLPIGTHNFWNLDLSTQGSPQSWWVFKFDGILSPHIPIVIKIGLQSLIGGTQIGGYNAFDNRTPYSLIQHNNINPVISIQGPANPTWIGYFGINGHVGDGIRVSSKDSANPVVNVTIDHAYVAAADAATGSPLRIDEGGTGVGGFNYTVKGGLYRSGPTSMYPSIWATTTQDLHVQEDVVLVNSGPRLDGAVFTTAVNGKAVFRNILTESFKTPFLLLDGTGGLTAMITIDRLEMADNIFPNITLLENIGNNTVNNITVMNSTGWSNTVTTYSNNVLGLRIIGDRAGSNIGPGTNVAYTVLDNGGSLTANGQQYTFGDNAPPTLVTLYVQAKATAAPATVTKALAGQFNNLHEWQDSTGVARAAIDATAFRYKFCSSAGTSCMTLDGAPTANRTHTFPDNTGTVAELNLAQTWTAKQTFNVGIGNNGTGLQHIRVASCTTAAAAGSTCTTTITWTSAFADANYTAVCVIDGPTGVPYVLNTSSKAAASVVVTIANLTAVAASGSLNCVGAHD